ncbi:hypothetical protein [Nonomuraea jabiensis]|uniref:hypothetical protein n=1 Tax=Nonomuraea jabiensis TaxID=882448 RepID=UPI003D75B073
MRSESAVLGADELETASGTLETLKHFELAAYEIDVVPTESEEFPTASAAPDQR